jgi:deoxycytidylate deaminase
MAMHNPDDALCDSFCPRATTTNPQPHYLDCVSIHAEANALLRISREDAMGGRLYCTGPICWECAKLIANSGIVKVWYVPDSSVSHRNEDAGIQLLKQCSILVKPWMT